MVELEQSNIGAEFWLPCVNANGRTIKHRCQTLVAKVWMLMIEQTMLSHQNSNIAPLWCLKCWCLKWKSFKHCSTASMYFFPFLGGFVCFSNPTPRSPIGSVPCVPSYTLSSPVFSSLMFECRSAAIGCRGKSFSGANELVQLSDPQGKNVLNIASMWTVYREMRIK